MWPRSSLISEALVNWAPQAPVNTTKHASAAFSVIVPKPRPLTSHASANKALSPAPALTNLGGAQPSHTLR